MKKRVIFFMLFSLCFCLCASTISVSAATGNTQTSTKTTKKITTKKETLKKAATKTSTTTKKTTSKKKVTKKSGANTTITETTIITTVKSSTKKKSKIRTIETTVVTTIKTTKITSVISSTTTNNNVSKIGFTITKFSDMKEHVNSKIYNAFNNLGFTLKINTSLSTTGSFDAKTRCIQLKKGNSSYLLHELGHFLSAIKGRGAYIDQTSAFKSIYTAEKNEYKGNNKSYVIADSSEYFAESFRDYTEDPNTLKKQRPRTYDYIHSLINSLSENDIIAFRNQYSWMWLSNA